MTDTPASPRRSGAALLGLWIGWILVYVVARMLLERDDLSAPLRVAVALLPLPPFALALRGLVRGIAGMDELERRIHLEALAIAFPLVMLLLMTLGLLELAVELNRNDWSYRHVWAYLPCIYFMGVAIARRRYS